MKTSILSILLLMAAGAAPTTQPGNAELRQLKSNLAVLETTYGNKYPAIIELRDQIAVLEASGANADAAVNTVPAPTTSNVSMQLLRCKVDLAVCEKIYGTKNPQTLMLQARIDAYKEKGGTINWEDENAMFQRAVAQRQELLKKLPAQNPDVIYITREIAYLASLLAGDAN